MDKKQSLSSPRGLNRETHPSQLKNTESPFVLNGSNQTQTGEFFNIPNESSNYFSVDFPEGYKVIGYERHPFKQLTYFFLTNPETGYSSVGYVENNISDLTFSNATEQVCEDCHYFEVLPTPLEETTQTPYSEYVEFFNDDCNKEFNFSINHPIKHIEIKVDKIGTKIYFVDGYNPDRWFDADNIEYYKYRGEVVCGVDETIPVCVATEKMLQRPNYTIPTLEAEAVQLGGNLRKGSYQFLIAYSDLAGNEISDYFSIVQPIDIFDANNRILDQTQLDSFTNFGIRLHVDNLDTTFKYYKVVVIERVAVNQAESSYEVGVFPTSDDTIYYTSSQTGTENLGGITKRINYERIISKRPVYEHTAGIESSNKQLIKWGITGKKFPNLQPVVNLIGGMLKWNTSVAKESLYKNAIATSKYRGYMREEVEPFAMRFFNKDGSEYPLMPLIPRPAREDELQIIPESDKNLQSVTAVSTNCVASERNKRWQIYNTATVEGICAEYNTNGKEVTQTQTAECSVQSVDEFGAGEIEIQTAEPDLKYYINTNREEIINPSSELYQPSLVPYLTGEYEGASCDPNFDSVCGIPEQQSYYVQVQEVENEAQTIIYDEDISNYSQHPPPAYCQPFQQGSTPDGYVHDTAFEDAITGYDLTTVYKRTGNFFNESCANAIVVDNNIPTEQGVTAYYNNYYGGLTTADLIDPTRTVATTNTNFLSNLHKGALWFKINKNNRSKIILQITQNTACTITDDIPEVSQLRYSIFSGCSATVAATSAIINTTAGAFTILDVSAYPDVFYVAIEAPIVETTNLKYRTAPPCGCYSILTRDLTPTSIEASFDNIIFEKIITYIAECTFTLPEINNCDPIPYQFGSFAYWESLDQYPDNEQLYDSSWLDISPSDLTGLTTDQIQSFESLYTDGVDTEGQYALKPTTDLRCKPIRHYKFPSNIIAPFMGTQSNIAFGESLIFPLGISLDNEVVNRFLDIAVRNEMLTQKQRDEIAGYEILKGDNSIHKSIVSNAVAFDMYKYTEKEKEVLYANYPLNDLGRDLLHYQSGAPIPHPSAGLSNFNFSALSPEFSLSKPTLPTEVIFSGYQLGNSRMYFNEVEEHPKWVLLTNTAKNTALALALAEVALEIAIKIADYTVQSTASQWFIAIGGTSTGGGGSTGAAALPAGIAALAIAQAVGGVVKTGEYRLQWLRTIRDLGQPRNFTSYCAAEGFNNTFLPTTSTDELLRGITTSKYMNPGRKRFIDETSGEEIRVNNRDREDSVFLRITEEYPILYPAEYRNYDNNLLPGGFGSRTIVSENGGVQGEEITRRSAVPYITLKNYIPNQWGTLGSIKWLSTSYRTYLEESTDCRIIYGGTVFICRDVQERKIPMFRADAMVQADLTPFNYSRYDNVGEVRNFVDYETGGTNSSLGSLLFPDISSEWVLDNYSDSGFYVRESSKFYLYYYGFVSYLTESEINTNFRYGGRQIKDQYFPDIQGDIVEFTQQKNRSIKEQPTYYYNSVYSRQVSSTPYITLPVTYDKAIYDKINDFPNGFMVSMPDVSENDLTDPWLIYKPLSIEEFESKHGRLISITDIGSQTLLARFENKELLLNSIVSIPTNATPISVELGSPGILTQRPFESPYGGTQNTDIALSKFGVFSTDAKRGQIYQRLGQEVNPISDIINGRPSGMKSWFREHLPFKILKYFPQLDIDNKFKSIGISLGLDNEKDRLFVTKRDYIPINDCIEFDEELGLVYNETTCDGVPPQITCPIGYTYNEETELCERIVTTNRCPEGYIFDEDTQSCLFVNSEPFEPCPPSVGYYVGGAFTSPDFRLGNSEVEMPRVDNFAVRVLKRDNLGRVYVGGSFTSVDSDTDLHQLIRLNFDGTLDETFDTGAGFTGAVADITQVTAIDVYPDGRVLVAGSFTAYDGNACRGLVRLFPDGSFDDSLDSTVGFVNRYPRAIKIVESEKILALVEGGATIGVGTTYNGVDPKGVIKIMPDGSVDGTFGGGARFRSFIYSTLNANQRGESIEIDNQGRYLIGGRTSEYNGVLSRHIVRIYPNGDLDPSFNVGEGLTFPPFDNDELGVYKVQMQENKILVAGRFTQYKGQSAQGLIRLLDNGDLDPTFNNDKIVAGGATTGDRLIYDMDTDQEGEILIGGNYTSYDGNSIPYITLTDVDGFVVPFTDPAYNNQILSVLNAPRCEQCISPCYLTTVDGQQYCNCPEYIEALPCPESCESASGLCSCTYTTEPTTVDVVTPVDFNNPEYFEDVSWTMSYDILKGAWNSYHSFKPDYYVNYDSEFFTGLNYSPVAGSLWAHSGNNKSFQVYYGERFPYIIEMVVPAENVKKILDNISVTTEVKYWQNQWDSVVIPIIGFNKMIIYTNSSNSGLLELVKQKTLQDLKKYPQTNGNTQSILYTNEDGESNINYFYDRVINNKNNVPLFLWDKNMINKEINPKAVSFKGKKLLERIKGSDTVIIRLISDDESRLSVIVEKQINDETVYE